MALEGLPQEVIAALLERHNRPKNVRAAIVRNCGLCNATFQNGYCPSIDCGNNPYYGDTTRECGVCGFCETPEGCAWSVVCPVCGAGIGLHCYDKDRIAGLHKERWLTSGRRT